MIQRIERGLKFTLENEAQRVFGFFRSGCPSLEPVISSAPQPTASSPEKEKKKIIIISLSLSLSLSLSVCESACLFFLLFFWNGEILFLKESCMYIYIYHVSLSLSLSLSLEAVMMLVIVLVECEIWGIVERVRFPWRGDPDGLFVSRSQNWQPFVAAMAIRVPFLCLI